MRNLILAVAALGAVVAFMMVLPEPGAPQPAQWPAQSANTFLLRDANVFDGERLLGRRDVLVQDGRITAVAPRVPLPKDVLEISAEGHTLLPAFIDAHTHNYLDARRDALRFGVGTQIDLFTSVDLLAAARAERESLDRTDQADMWSAGNLVTAAGGHGTQFGLRVPTLDSAADADSFIAARVAEGSDFIKLVVESGRGWGHPMPTLDRDILDAAIKAAHARGKQVIVHAGSHEEARMAIDAGADGLAHVFGDAPADELLLALASEGKVFLVPTLAVMESIGSRDNGLREDARLSPHLSAEQRESLGRRFPSGGSGNAVFANALANTAALHRAGVTILAGSDAPNPGTAHGASLHRELELLVEAGLKPAEVLAAATSRTAERFGLEDRGQIASGKRADLVLVASNPLTDITATRDIVAVWKNGYRIERTRFDATEAVAAPTPDDPVLGQFEDGVNNWVATTDSIRGGASTVSVAAENGLLQVEAEVRPGFAWPWAGAMRMLGGDPTVQVDLSAFERLHVRLRTDAASQILLFSGAPGGMPAQWPVTEADAWQDIEVPLTDVPGFDPAHAWAVAVVAGPGTGPARIEIESVTLR